MARDMIRASGFHTSLFARQIGMPDAELLFPVLFGERPLTPLLIERICARFPQIDARWLLTGRVGGGELDPNSICSKTEPE